MGKKSVSWPDFLKIKFQEKKKNNSALQFKELLQDASVKTEWKKITDGSHPDYAKGAMVRKAKTAKKDKTMKNKKTASPKDYNGATAQDILDNCDLCSKCTKKVRAYLNDKKTGGDSVPASIADSSQPSLLQQEQQQQQQQQEKTAVTLHAGGKKKRGGCVGTCPMGGGGKKKNKKTRTRRHRK
jgi:hypothetical protein